MPRQTLAWIVGSVLILFLGGTVYFAARRGVAVPQPPGAPEISSSTSTPSVSSPVAPSDMAESGPFTLPAGFGMAAFAEGVPNARVIAFDPKGVMLVSQPSRGTISALPDGNGDGKADRVETVVGGLNGPHGMAFRGDRLYVAEEDSVSVFEYDANARKTKNKKKLLDLPAGGGHSTRTLLFLPAPDEDTLLVSVGSSCNVCREADERRAAILAYNIETGRSELYAKGLRNAVFMELHPVSGKVYATEMGRDMLGDDIPPDEINIVEKDKHYGWPVCYGKNIHDTNFDKNTYIRNPCMEPFETGSLVDLQAHSAPLGLAFIPEEGWQEAYWYDMLVAFHDSWNRSVPTGYKIVRLLMNAQGKYSGTEDFITGWLRPDGTRLGRPVDVKVLPGGTIYISDDYAGKVYRVTRK